MTRTPEEIKIGMECCARVGYCYKCPYQEECYHPSDDACPMHMDALAYIRQLEARVPRWIPVNERLPEEGTYVIVAASGVGGLYTTEAALEGVKWVVESDSVHGDLCAENVTYWTYRLNHPL